MSRVYDVALRNAVTGQIVHVEGHGNTQKSAKRHAFAHWRDRCSEQGLDIRDWVFNSIRFKAQAL